MIIAVDDAGDPGMKLGRGSSDYFVIASVLFEDDLDAEETALKIKRLRQKLGWKPKHEFKFRKTSPENRKIFLNQIKNCNFKVSLAIIDKRNFVSDGRFAKDASKFYNAVILNSIQAFTVKLNYVHLYIDGEGGMNYRKTVRTFFRKNLGKNTLKELTYRDSSNDNLIQLADMIAGAARRSVERDKDSSYLNIIKKRIVHISTTIDYQKAP